MTIFDDYSSVTKQTFGMARTEYKFSESLFIAGYYANFTLANAQFANASDHVGITGILPLRVSLNAKG